MIVAMDKEFEKCHNMTYVEGEEANVSSFHTHLSCSDLVSDLKFVDTCRSNTESNKESRKQTTESIIVRSVAMSANIASTVTSEVSHLIRVDAFNNCDDEVVADVPENVAPLLSPATLKKSSCSHILPTQENIISGIILSKWDDIMGPQTVYAWLQNHLQEFDKYLGQMSNQSNQAEENDSSYECVHSTNIHLMKAINYVTSHTVNYMGVTTANLPSSSHFQTFTEKNTSLFIVRDLNLVAQSLMFQLRTRELHLPYSLAIMIKYDQYNYYLHLQQLSQLWLRWISAQLHHLLVLCIQQNKEFVTSDAVDQWMLEFNSVLLSLKSCGLGHLSETWKFPLQIIKHPLLERALTSHLQTFGCTVVMGSCVDRINDLIVFLSLFLEADELCCSRLLRPPFSYSFHKGLYLQGLILDEFGCRELNSEELSANPYPVTAIDLSRGTNLGAIKQSTFFRRSTGASKHQCLLCPAKDSRSKLVHSIVNDLKLVPMKEWKSLARLFLEKIKALAHTLLSLMLDVSVGSNAGSGRKPTQLQRYLSHAMGLEDSDFLIVLASADKLKPGTYTHVLYSHLESR